MLSTWGGNNGIDTISQVELDCVGFDTCAEYCKEYCWHYGMGYCGNCAYDKERTKRRDAESKDKETEIEDFIKKNFVHVEDKPGFVWFSKRNFQIISIETLVKCLEDAWTRGLYHSPVFDNRLYQ